MVALVENSKIAGMTVISTKSVFYDILGKGLVGANIDTRDDLSHCKK